MPLDGGTELPPGAGHKVKRLNPSCFPERPQKLQKGAQVKPGAVLFTGLQQGTTAGPAFPSLVLNRQTHGPTEGDPPHTHSSPPLTQNIQLPSEFQFYA